MSERKQQLLHKTVEIIAEQGYGALTMRALTRACDTKLGALQYHFRTRADLYRDVVAYISAQYRKSFTLNIGDLGDVGLHELVTFMIDGLPEVNEALQIDRLWPQLMAMAQVEPLVAELLDEIHLRYLRRLEELLKDAGAQSPRAEALCLMSMIRGASLFVGKGKRWEEELGAVRQVAIKFVAAKYGDLV